MKTNLWTPVLVMIAVVSGLVVLLSYFISLPVLLNLRALLLDWATILIAVALVVGVLNLIRAHWAKFRTRQPSFGYSLVLLISLVVTVAVILGLGGPASPASLWIYDYLLLPVETSLMALLAVILIFAIGRMFYRRTNLFTIIFAGTVLFLVISLFLANGMFIPGLSEFRNWFLHSWAVAGARGILLGVVLGTIATGLRVLMGSDRPYGG
jgi:hypothetical protein